MEVREKEILKKSDYLFRKRGFKQVTMDDIARELGMSKKTVYKYFDNKKQLILTNIKSQIEKEKGRLCSMQEESKDAIEEMVQLITHVMRMFDETDPGLFDELKRFYPTSFDLMIGFMKDHIYTRIEKNIKRGKGEGIYRSEIDSDILAKMYVAKVRSIMDEDWFPIKEYDRKNLLLVFIEYHIRGIANEHGIALFEKYKTEGLSEVSGLKT